MKHRPVPLITCEHGGRKVPARYARFFRSAQSALDSHRGYDPGALDLAQRIAQRLRAPLHFSTTTRLLVDLNRSLGHPSLHSEFVRPLDASGKQAILRDHYEPYRSAVEHEIASRVKKGHQVQHLSIHSFTPAMNGQIRNADVAVLYDPRRPLETALADRWLKRIDEHFPGLRLRRNYPYRGTSDGFTTHLRRIHPPAKYLGLELEVNQQFPLASRAEWSRLRQAIVLATQHLLDDGP
jgi:predicted N-formylglutamate amidohydrolase